MSRQGASTATITAGDRAARNLEHHGDAARQALRDLWATPLASLLTLLVMAIALGLPMALQVALNNLEALAGRWDGAAEISLFLKPELDRTQAEALGQKLKARPGVGGLRLIDKDAALAEFRARSGFGEALNELDANPLPHVLVLTPADLRPEAAEKLLVELRAEPGVDLAQLDLDWVKRLAAILAVGQRALLLVGAALALGVLLVTGNTIRLAVENRREEIEVQKLVGGTDAFIRRPFLYSGFLQGALAGVLAWGLVGAGLAALSGPVAALGRLYGSAFALGGVGILPGLALVLGAGLLGWLGAFLAVSRRLKLIEPA